MRSARPARALSLIRTGYQALAGPGTSARPSAARTRLMHGDLLVIAPWLIFGAAVIVLCLRLRPRRARWRKGASPASRADQADRDCPGRSGRTGERP